MHFTMERQGIKSRKKSKQSSMADALWSFVFLLASDLSDKIKIQLNTINGKILSFFVWYLYGNVSCFLLLFIVDERGRYVGKTYKMAFIVWV